LIFGVAASVQSVIILEGFGHFSTHPSGK